MGSHRKLQLSKETLRCLTSDLPTEGLVGVRGGGGDSVHTCVSCLECITKTTTVIAPTLVQTECWHTR